MEWRWTRHILHQSEERNIPRELIEATLASPDKIVTGQKLRKIYQKIFSDKLLKVVTESDWLITAYMTDKIEKYMEEGDKG